MSGVVTHGGNNYRVGSTTDGGGAFTVVRTAVEPIPVSFSAILAGFSIYTGDLPDDREHLVRTRRLNFDSRGRWSCSIAPECLNDASVCLEPFGRIASLPQTRLRTRHAVYSSSDPTPATPSAAPTLFGLPTPAPVPLGQSFASPSCAP